MSSESGLIYVLGEAQSHCMKFSGMAAIFTAPSSGVEVGRFAEVSLEGTDERVQVRVVAKQNQSQNLPGLLIVVDRRMAG